MGEFVFGYTEMMNSPHIDPSIRGHMMNFLQVLMEDTNVRPWPQVRHFHMVIIQAMEAGQITWGDADRILAIQRQHVRTGMPAQPTPPPRRVVNTSRTPSSGITPMYCPLYQTNACERPTDHDSPRGFVQHICAYCLRATGRAINSHGEQDCRRRKAAEEAKNGQQA